MDVFYLTLSISYFKLIKLMGRTWRGSFIRKRRNKMVTKTEEIFQKVKDILVNRFGFNIEDISLDLQRDLAPCSLDFYSINGILILLLCPDCLSKKLYFLVRKLFSHKELGHSLKHSPTSEGTRPCLAS